MRRSDGDEQNRNIGQTCAPAGMRTTAAPTREGPIRGVGIGIGQRPAGARQARSGGAEAQLAISSVSTASMSNAAAIRARV